MTVRLVLIGGGEHARAVLDVLVAAGRLSEVAGFVDPTPCEETVHRFGVRRLGGEDSLSGLERMHGILGFGGVRAAAARVSAVERIEDEVAAWASAIHPTVVLSGSAAVGAGTVVMPGAVIGTGASIGRHCVINTGTIVEHDVEVGDHVQAGPGVVIGGGVVIGVGAYLGLGAKIRDHVRIGANAVVGMGAVVTRDVAVGTRVLGVPARPR